MFGVKMNPYYSFIKSLAVISTSRGLLPFASEIMPSASIMSISLAARL